MGTARDACHEATAYLAEKPSLTNRIGRHFARIKAVSGTRRTIMVTASNCPREARQSPGMVQRRSFNGGTNPNRLFGKIGPQRLGELWETASSGHVRTKGRGDDATDHAADGIGCHA